MEDYEVDAVFCDIKMPGLDGMIWRGCWLACRRPQIVFVTAYDERAVDAFTVGATN